VVFGVEGVTDVALAEGVLDVELVAVGSDGAGTVGGAQILVTVSGVAPAVGAVVGVVGSAVAGIGVVGSAVAGVLVVTGAAGPKFTLLVLPLPSLEMWTMSIGASTLTFWNCSPTSPKPPSFPCVWLPLPATDRLLDPETFWLMPIGAGSGVGVANVVAAGVAGQTVGAGVEASTGRVG
jgi:hypothetical protein